MEEEFMIEKDGIQYTAYFIVFGDSVTVHLPNGEQRSSYLKGMSPESAARPHLRSYINNLTQQKK